MNMNMNMRAWFIVVLTPIGCVGALGTAWAGSKVEENVSISVSGTTATAVGILGTARNSADTNQFIGCTIQGFPTGNAVFCSARTAKNQFFSCTANDNSPSLAAAVSAIGPASRLFIVAESGVCVQIDVGNKSQNKPMVP